MHFRKKGERCTAPYASTHHIIFLQPWMRPSHRHPLCCRAVRAKTFHNTSSTQCRENSFLGLHRAEPSGRIGSVFILQQHGEPQRAWKRKKDGLLFSEIWRATSYYSLSFMWSGALFTWCLQNLFYFCFPTMVLFWFDLIVDAMLMEFNCNEQCLLVLRCVNVTDVRPSNWPMSRCFSATVIKSVAERQRAILLMITNYCFSGRPQNTFVLIVFITKENLIHKNVKLNLAFKHLISDIPPNCTSAFLQDLKWARTPKCPFCCF